MSLFKRIMRALWRKRPAPAPFPQRGTKAHTSVPGRQPTEPAPAPDACNPDGALALAYLQALARKAFDGATETIDIYLGAHHRDGFPTPKLFAWVSRLDVSLCEQFPLAGQDHHQVLEVLCAGAPGHAPKSGAFFSRTFAPITGSAHAQMAARAALLAELPPALRAVPTSPHTQEDLSPPPDDLRLLAIRLHTTRRLSHLLTQTSQDILAQQDAQIQSLLQAMENSRPADGP